MSDVRAKIELEDFDVLFSGKGSDMENRLISSPIDKADYPIVEINIDMIDEFPNHPFRVLDDEEMNRLSENIAEYGVLHPALVRKVNNRYQMVSGHRRLFACKKIGKITMPVRIMNLSDEEATILMTDANFLQRDNILPSEKARAYKQKYEAIKRQGKRGTGNSLKELGEAASESDKTVQRFIRLSYLSDALLRLVDANKLGIKQGVELSYLPEVLQDCVLGAISDTGINMTVNQAKRIKELGVLGNLSTEMLNNILVEKKNKARVFTMKADKLNQFFNDDVSDMEIESIIMQLLVEWKGGTNHG